jgi:uncharacterized membrane protein YfcA
VDPALLAGAVIALAVSALTTPAGVSGAVFLLPVQVGLLGVASPAATPTNLLFNLIATPGGLLRWWRTGGLDLRLAGLLSCAAVPAAAAGAVLRVQVLSGRLAVLALIGVVLTAMGLWLALGRPAAGRRPPPGTPAVLAVAALAGLIGGAYGIGGGSVIAPSLVALGLPVARVAPAAIATTLVTSAAGIAAFEALAVAGDGGRPVGPDWPMGIALGVGGAAGAYLGARWAGHADERRLRRGLGAVALAVGLGHLLALALDVL